MTAHSADDGKTVETAAGDEGPVHTDVSSGNDTGSAIARSFGVLLIEYLVSTNLGPDIARAIVVPVIVFGFRNHRWARQARERLHISTGISVAVALVFALGTFGYEKGAFGWLRDEAADSYSPLLWPTLPTNRVARLSLPPRLDALPIPSVEIPLPPQLASTPVPPAPRTTTVLSAAIGAEPSSAPSTAPGGGSAQIASSDQVHLSREAVIWSRDLTKRRADGKDLRAVYDRRFGDSGIVLTPEDTREYRNWISATGSSIVNGFNTACRFLWNDGVLQTVDFLAHKPTKAVVLKDFDERLGRLDLLVDALLAGKTECPLDIAGQDRP